MKNNQLNSLILDNRYQIQQKLSHKAGRQTLLAKEIESQELVIIKLLQFDSLFQWDDLKLFEREAKTLKNLNHPAIPKYLDYFEVDNEQIRGFALVQTYIDAPSLAEIIQQGRKFTEAEIIELAQKLLTMIDYLHSSNPPVIHRDIKPSNILLSNRTGNSVGELYLVDFGSVQTVYTPCRIHYQLISINKNRSVKRTNYFSKKPKKLKWLNIYAAGRLNLIVYNPGYTFDNCVSRERKKVSFSEVKIPPQLSLHANEQEYVIGNQRQSKAELLWLGKEISDFLGLELQVIYPTPKIPPKPIEPAKPQKSKGSNSFLPLSDIYY